MYQVNPDEGFGWAVAEPKRVEIGFLPK